MGPGISEVLTFAVGVAISPLAVVAVILTLFSRHAKVNAPAFLTGWVVALAALSTVVYVLAHDGNVATSSTASDSVSWGKIVLGVALVALAFRHWHRRPAAGTTPPEPKWMAAVDALTPGKTLALGMALAVANPKNLLLTLGAASGLAQVRGLSTADAVVALVVFVVVGSLTIAGPVLYGMLGGAHARAALDSARVWLTEHNDAVLGALFLVFGVDLIAKGLPPLTS
jgi:Sap-like sulfolipid-1-addressing protein